MVSFNADLADPPGVSTNDLSGSAMRWVGYILIAGMAIVAFGIAQQVVAPLIGNFAQLIPGVDSPQGGIPVNRVS